MDDILIFTFISSDIHKTGKPESKNENISLNGCLLDPVQLSDGQKSVKLN